MATGASIALLTLLAVLLIMAGEAALSAVNERVLRSRGAVPPHGEDGLRDERLHRVMLWAYPASFVAMTIEGALWGPASPRVLAAGLAVFGLSKAIKMWTISTLGGRWTFRILVMPGASPIDRGPYALVRHPNYFAVLGELAGVAMLVGAPVSGVLAVVLYGGLLRRKIAIEDRALGRQ